MQKEASLPGPGQYAVQDPWEARRLQATRQDAEKNKIANQANRELNTTVSDRLFMQSLKPAFVMGQINPDLRMVTEPDSSVQDSVIDPHLARDRSRQKIGHVGTAVWSKMKEQRLDPVLCPGTSWHQMRNQTPGPDAYELLRKY